MLIDELRQRVHSPSPTIRRLACIEAADWFKDICLTFGCEPETAYTVAGAVAKGLEVEAGRAAAAELEAG